MNNIFIIKLANGTARPVLRGASCDHERIDGYIDIVLGHQISHDHMTGHVTRQYVKPSQEKLFNNKFLYQKSVLYKFVYVEHSEICI